MTTSREAAIICAVLEVLPAAPRDLSYLLEDLTSVEDLLEGPSSDSSRSGVMRRYISEATDPQRVVRWEQRFAAIRVRLPDLQIVSVRDSNYPSAVRGAYDRPPLLYFRGRLPDTCSAAVVGSRQASKGATDFAMEATRELVSSGCAIVSGLARGIDAVAHETCVLDGGLTIAVLGHALDSDLYPPEHDNLAKLVLKSGAVVSQFRPGSPPTPSSFVQRNALISAFAQVSLVITADERSGSRSELDAALAQGRIAILPGFAAAKHRWIRALASSEDRVHIADTPEDVGRIAAEACALPADAAVVHE